LPADAVLVMEKIHLALDAPFDLGDGFLDVSVSIGIAHFPEDGNNRQELVSHADETMYAAKAEAAALADSLR
jgi:diguanylate cyclase (GGDEF)-like protein